MTKDELFDLCVYLATSAEGLKEELKEYGLLWLLEILGWLVVYAAKSHDDTFLHDIATEVRTNKDLAMKDSEVFYGAIEELVIKFALEAR